MSADLQQVFELLRRHRRSRAIERAREKTFQEKLHREVELFLDDMEFQGLSWDREQDRLPIALAWMTRLGIPLDDHSDFDHGERDQFTRGEW